MKYIINIDKSPYGNPSEDLRQYEIDIDVLRRKGNTYDSLIIDDTARVIRRIEHKNGEDYILENPIIENLSMIKIELFQGVNYIYITIDGEILSTSTIVIDYLLKNDFTETYPTIIEMHSAIEQSASNIILQVEKKADADKIISLINLSPEQITIDSSRISLKGKEIDLTSDNIIIKSNNFSVDENGNMSCKSGTFENGSILITRTYPHPTGEYIVTENLLKVDKNNIEIGGFLMYPRIDTMSGAGFPTLGIENSLDEIIDIFSYNKTENNPIDAHFNSTVANYVSVGKILEIPKISTQGYGLTNSDGVSIIRDHNNQNVSVDATGDTLYLGFQNTVGINILSNKVLINSNGRITNNEEIHTQNVIPNSNDTYNLGASSYRWNTGYIKSGELNTLHTTGWIHCDANFTGSGNVYLDNGAIRNLYAYNNDTLTNASNMYITSNGWIRRTTNTSSYRVKKDIKRYKKENDINEELNPEKLYDVKVWQFKYRDEYFKNKNDKRYDKDLIGFILEDMARKYPIAVDYDEDENGILRPESWNSQYLIPAMLYLIQEQHKEIEELKSLMKGE